MNPNRFLFLIIFLSVSVSVFGQELNSKLKKADKLYEERAYPAAIRLYEKGLQKSEDWESRERLADCYWQIRDVANAEEAYKVLANDSKAGVDHYLAYGQILRYNGKYDEAKPWFEKSKSDAKHVEDAQKGIDACNYALAAQADSGQYQIRQINVNTESSEIGPVPFGQSVVFASSRRRGFFRRVLNLQTEELFYDMYLGTPSLKGSKGYEVKGLEGKVNTRFHEGPGAFDKARSTLYFTRSNLKRNSPQMDGKINRLKLYMATANGDKWEDVAEMPFNSETYSCAHPSISVDGKTLIFLSDMPGGQGGTDLYKVTKEGKKWGTPENLGPEINTPGNEQFPFLNEDGTLFFSSDYHEGMGGMDIFFASPNKSTGLWSGVRNAGYGINSHADDFGVSFIAGSPKGYFSSDRNGNDDIFFFSRKLPMEIQIVDSRTKKPVKGVSILAMDNSNKSQTVTTDGKGVVNFNGDWGKEYFLTVTAPDYLPTKKRASSKTVGPIDNWSMKIEIEQELIFRAIGTVKDFDEQKPLAGVEVLVVGDKGEKSIKTDSEGKFEYLLDFEQEYTLIMSKDGYRHEIRNVSTKGMTDPFDFQIEAYLKKGDYMLVSGMTLKKADNSPLDAVTIRGIETEKFEQVSAQNSRSDGRFWLPVKRTAGHYIIGSRKGYFSAREELAGPYPKDTALGAVLPLVEYKVGALVKTIYYEYNKSNISGTYGRDLDEISYFLVDNPSAAVELASHTDCRGSDRYNLSLSERRAGAAVSYIRRRGIKPRRIFAKGYGESKLFNLCDCLPESNCGEDLHQLNRRTEITVTEIEPIEGDFPEEMK